MKYIAKVFSFILVISFSITSNGECLRPASISNVPAGITGLHKAISDGNFYKLLQIIHEHPTKSKVEAVESFIVQSSDSTPVKIALYLTFECRSYRAGGLFAELDYYQRLELISKSLSLALRRLDSEDIYEFLKGIISTPNEEVLPEARKFISSYVTVYEIKEPIKVATTFSLYKAWEKIKPYSDDNPTGQNYLRKKIRQLQDLYNINPNITWQLVVVQDGDDRRFPDHARKSIDLAREIVEKDFPGLIESQQVVFLELPQHTKEMIDGAKGGAILYGLRWAVENGADYGIYTDGTLGTHLGEEGLLLDAAINENQDIVIGSIYRPDSLVPRRKLTRITRSRIWLSLTKALFPGELLRITDTQRSFKCFSREALKIVLPVDERYNFDRHFVYDFSFDAVLLALAKKAGLMIGERGIVWVDFPALSTIRAGNILNMVKGLIKGRLFLSFYSKDYIARARKYHASRRAESARKSEEKVLMEESTKAKELYFKDIPTIDKIKFVLSNYDLGADSIKDVKFVGLPGVPTRPPILLETPKGEFVIKYAGKDIDCARFIVSTILYLKKQKRPVAPLIESKKRSDVKIDDYWVQARDDYFLMVEKYIEGKIHHRIGAGANRLAQLGAFIADLHNVIADFKPAGAKQEKRLIDVADYQKDIMALRDGITASLDRQPQVKLSRGERLFIDYYDLIMRKMEDLSRNLAAASYETLPKSVVNGDINFNNIIYYPESQTIKGFFDWDKSRIQPRVEDFKNAVMALPQGEGRTYDLESAIAVVLGYQLTAKDKLTPSELAAIPEILSGTFLWTCCSYFLLNMKRLNTDDSYYKVAVKDLAIFKRFDSENDLLKAILLDSDNIIKKYNLIKQDEIDDELIGRMIAQKRKQFNKAAPVIEQPKDFIAADLLDRQISLLAIGTAA